MKFTKEQAIKELEAKIPNKGQTLNISKRTISEQVETLLPLIANDEMELDDFVTKVLPLFKSADGNIKNDVSQGIKTYIDANPPKQKEDDKPKDDSELQKLLERVAALEKEKENNDKKKKIEGVRNKIAEKMKELGVKNEKWIQDFLSNTRDIENEDEVEETAKSYTELYNKFLSSIDPSITPNEPNGGGRDKYKDDIIKQAAEIAKQSRLEE